MKKNELDRLLNEHENTFNRPGWKSHLKVAGFITQIIGLLYLLTYLGSCFLFIKAVV